MNYNFFVKNIKRSNNFLVITKVYKEIKRSLQKIKNKVSEKFKKVYKKIKRSLKN